MQKIIKVEPVVKQFTIQWMLGSFCNYDCMYCPDYLHDKHSRPHDLETLKQAWFRIWSKTKDKNLKYKICFSGGEVTANKSFLPLVTWLTKNYPEIQDIIITTNGSASIGYYKKLAEQVSSIIFSVHSEFINEAKFFENARILNGLMVRPGKSFHVNVMNEYWNQERIKLYTDFLDCHQIAWSLNEIDYSFQTRKEIKFEGRLNFDKIRESSKL